MSEPISVTMITKNASSYIAESLDALRSFDEVIILDNGSTDDTIKLAQNFANVTIYQSEFIGFGPLKNLAISYAKNSWILSVDSDEILSKELVDEIESISLDPSKVYAIVRDNYYDQKLMRCCGWEDDAVERLFCKEQVKFNDNQVHESLILPQGVSRQKLHYRLKHYTYASSEELITKMQRYSTLWARDWVGKKSSSPTKALLRSLFAFIKFYFFKKGFLSGYEGLLISTTNANSVFYKYMKLYELNKNIKDIDEDTH